MGASAQGFRLYYCGWVVMVRQMRVLALKASGAAIKSIYVFGCRNSGTNYVNSLIMNNCGTSEGGTLYNAQNKARLGWKHGFPMMLAAPRDVLTIAVHREPIAWLHSMNRTPWHAAKRLHNIAFSQFIRTEWVSIIDDEGFGISATDPLWHSELLSDRDPLTGLRFANVMQLRNAKNRGFRTLDHRSDNVLRVNYETVLADPEGFLDGVCTAYGLRRKRAFDPIVYDRGTPSRGLFQAKPVPQISEADLELIRSELDLHQENNLGYELPLRARLYAA